MGLSRLTRAKGLYREHPMPSRWQCLLIVAFWLGATGLLYVRELEPVFREHDPPPYVIELTAETQVVHPRVIWKVFQNDREEESYLAKTWMDHNEADDSFTLFADVKPAPLQKESVRASLLIQHMESSYRVSREGKLREFSASADLSSRLLARFGRIDFTPRFELNGTVVDGPEMIAQLRLPQLKGLFPGLEKSFRFPVSQNGTIFLPLHPVHKIHGVRPGKSWRVPEVDPLGNAARAWFRSNFPIGLPGGEDRYLEARVREKEVRFPFDMGDEQSHYCWVIDYTAADEEKSKTTATTWVEVDTDLVLSQEAKSEAGHLRLVRDSARSKVR
jgi:hypothetical protein